MNRREFLARAALATIGLGACSVRPPLPEPGALERNGRSRKVVVIGAGLAGLVAGYELTQAGHDVTILEARDRPGGRCYTLRGRFDDGLYAEAGAHFIPDNHHFTLRYARLFNLQLDPIVPRHEGKLYYVRGKRLLATRGAQVDWPFRLTPEEAKLGRGGIWAKYVLAGVKELGDPTAADWPPRPLLDRYDRLSAAEYIRSRGASPEALALLALGYLDLNGEGVESYSALLMLRDLALRQTEKQTFAIRGGNDLLPKAFAERLAGKIRYGAPVVRIEPGERSAVAVVQRQAESARLQADHVICTVPFSVLRRIEVSPAFSREKQAAIAGLAYTSAVRVFVQSSRRFWDDQGLPSSATTDLPIKWIWSPTVNQPGQRGILECETVSEPARRISAMGESERIRFALGEMEKVYPGIRDHFERGASKSWESDAWARGAYCYFKPGQMASLLPHIARPEGRVHFAGEHASTWPQWMQGALESGLRAAGEVNDAA